ncbi:unnamed protein product [Phytophthora fragariaefolia]|uniref:Unnamed protein product n=1 Tax=Phytophthora fragariaefolia TaxID=1490495 RepID=A0A9W6WXI0_9STRA|nr:unnamed protein product [Phytophthora fragariaefolia]
MAEEVVYHDCHAVNEEAVDWSSLNFSTIEQNVGDGGGMKNTEKIRVVESKDGEINGERCLALVEGKNDALHEVEVLVDNGILQEGKDPNDEDHGHHDEVVAEGEQLQDELRSELMGSLQAAPT